jgi:hypothetical protein
VEGVDVRARELDRLLGKRAKEGGGDYRWP